MTRRRERQRGAARTALLLALACGVVFHSWLDAQVRALAVIASLAPGSSAPIEALTDDPAVEDRRVAGVPATVVRPPDGDGPRVVFLNGVTRRGRRHPTVRRLTRALARAGYVVYVPDPRGLARGELTPATLADAAAVVRAAAADGAVALVGVSAGGTLALLVAQRPELRARVTVVSAVAPYAELRDVVRLATTGFHRERGRLVRYEHAPFVSLVVARSLAAALPPGRDREALLAYLRQVPDDESRPLDAFVRRRWTLGRDGRALVAVLRNRDPRRFDALFDALPRRARDSTRRLSPLAAARALRAPVELVSAPHDKYFPVAESRALVAAAPDARLTVSATLQHADLQLSFAQLADLARLDAFVVRSLRAAAAS